MTESVSRIGQITARSLQFVKSGEKPHEAWLKTLRELYSSEQLNNQIKHSCPKWAFCILCHNGYVKGVPPGCCPESEHKSSGNYTLSALKQLLANPLLASNKKELKRMVFGTKGTLGFRAPNGEVDVLLYLHGISQV